MKPAWSGFLLSLSLCLDLGIVNVAVLRITLGQGGTAGFLLGIGSWLGDLVYFTLAVVGATTLLKWQAVRLALWLFGTGVLLTLAWRMGREFINPRDLKTEHGVASQPRSPSALLVNGLGLALASPSSIMWFAAVGGSVIASFGSDRKVLWPFAVGFSIAAVLWSALFAYGVAAVKGIIDRRLIRALCLVSAGLFVYFALVVFLHGVRQLL